MTLTRRAFATTLATALGGSVAPLPSALRQRPRPSPSQLSWQRDELALFLHFGVNTFTDREWGDGREDPAVFNPTALDARQWARAGREAGARALILTAKHHDGFCLWPSGLTTHTVAGRRGGRGARVHRRVSARRTTRWAVSVAVGSQCAGVRGFAALQRLLLRAAHRAPHALRADCRDVVRRRQRRRAQRPPSGVRLAPRLRVGAAAAATRRRGANRTPDGGRWALRRWRRRTTSRQSARSA